MQWVSVAIITGITMYTLRPSTDAFEAVAQTHGLCIRT